MARIWQHHTDLSLHHAALHHPDREPLWHPIRGNDGAGPAVVHQDPETLSTWVVGPSAGPVPTMHDDALPWGAAHLLSKYLLAADGLGLRGKGLIELGAGCGMAGLSAACVGAVSLLTDRRPVAGGGIPSPRFLNLLVRNAAENSAAIVAGGGMVGVAELDWQAEEHSERAMAMLGAAGLNLGYIVASDVIYDRATTPDLIATVARLRDLASVAGPRPECLLAFNTRRSRGPSFELLTEMAAVRGWLLNPVASEHGCTVYSVG